MLYATTFTYDYSLTNKSFIFFQSRASLALVDKVREIYHSKNMDVRFLIPVLSGLSKQEVIAVLPKLIRLSPAVVKEVKLEADYNLCNGISQVFMQPHLYVKPHVVFDFFIRYSTGCGPKAPCLLRTS